MTTKLTHLDNEGKPSMVDVGGKVPSHRYARAEARVFLPKEVLDIFSNNEIHSAKGPVFQTAIIAGIMAAKQTGQLIPLCHPLGLDHVDVRIEMKGNEVIIQCEASLFAKTGVEMEALTGASVAALTVYDMCKAISHEIEINQVKLVEKEEVKVISPGHDKPLKGLVLAGGKSTRMGTDKAMIEYHGEPQFLFLVHLLQKTIGETFVSCRESQSEQYRKYDVSLITDKIEGQGPLVAIYSAMMQFPQYSWLVLACDLPLIDESVLSELISNRDTSNPVTSFRSPFDQNPEPLIAIWESHAINVITEAVNLGKGCPRKVMMNGDIKLIDPLQPDKLINVNSPSDISEMEIRLRTAH